MSDKFVIFSLIHFKDGSVLGQELFRGEVDACLRAKNTLRPMEASNMKTATIVTTRAEVWDKTYG